LNPVWIANAIVRLARPEGPIEPDALTQSLTERLEQNPETLVSTWYERGLSTELGGAELRPAVALKPAPTPIGCLDC